MEMMLVGGLSRNVEKVPFCWRGTARVMVDLEHHWGLRHNPFAPGGSGFVAVGGHVQAVMRLRLAVEMGERVASLQGPEGVGKTAVLVRALQGLREPGRRVVLVQAEGDGHSLTGRLVELLGGRVCGTESRALLWRMLGDRVKLCRLQGLGLVLGVDDAHELDDPEEIERLGRLDPHPRARISVLKVGRDEGAGSWGLSVRLAPLTRSEAAEYVVRKLSWAGRAEAVFTPRAMTRLHLRSEGRPLGVDRLAALALVEGAVRGLEVIGPEVVEGVVAECGRTASTHP